MGNYLVAVGGSERGSVVTFPLSPLCICLHMYQHTCSQCTCTTCISLVPRLSMGTRLYTHHTHTHVHIIHMYTIYTHIHNMHTCTHMFTSYTCIQYAHTCSHHTHVYNIHTHSQHTHMHTHECATIHAIDQHYLQLLVFSIVGCHGSLQYQGLIVVFCQ